MVESFTLSHVWKVRNSKRKQNSRGTRGPESEERLSQSLMQKRNEISWALKYVYPPKGREGKLGWKVIFTAF